MTETEAEAWRAWGLWEMLAKLQPENYGWSSRCPGEMGLWGFRQDCGGERRRGIGIYGQTREQIGRGIGIYGQTREQIGRGIAIYDRLGNRSDEELEFTDRLGNRSDEELEFTDRLGNRSGTDAGSRKRTRCRESGNPWPRGRKSAQVGNRCRRGTDAGEEQMPERNRCRRGTDAGEEQMPERNRCRHLQLFTALILRINFS